MAARRAFLGLYLLSGTTALLYQVVWSRLLTLEMGQTAAAVSTVLAAFMGGQALGAALAGRMAPRLSARRALVIYAGLELLVCAAALAVTPLLALSHPFLSAAYHDGAGGPLFVILRLLICLVIVTLPATAMGATFPIAVRWLEHDGRSAARTAGGLYAINTLGAAGGAALAGFALLPTLGLTQTMRIGVGVNVVIALGALLVSWWSPSPEPIDAPADASLDALDAFEVSISPVPSHSHSLALSRPLRSASSSSSSTLRDSYEVDTDDTGTFEAGAYETGSFDTTGSFEPNEALRGSRTGRQAAPRPKSAAVLLAISGCVALIYEVAWTRLLALTIGPTTYAFSAMLVACIFGIAVGAAIASRLVAHFRRPLIPLAVTQMLAALGAFAAARFVPSLPAWAAASAAASPDYIWLLTLNTAGIVLLLAPMTMALGAAFPFAVAASTPRDPIAGTTASDSGASGPRGAHAASARRSAARIAARLYTANTLGAIAGALLSGFVLIPNLGLQRTIVLAGALATVAGVELVWRTRRRPFTRTWVAGLGTLSIVAGLTLPDWDRKLLSGGAYRLGQSATDMQVGLDAGNLLYYGDGTAGTVAVRRIAGETTLSVNGRVEASDAADMLTQKLLAHLPLLLHPAPHDVCIVGLGSGVTAGAALTHPVDRVDTVELSREVVEASELFAAQNLGALHNPRGHLILGDGRSHLRLSSRTYDVIVSEPSTPWMAGGAPLFTRELFLAARERLNAGGLFCQWAQTHDISQPDLASILATFTDVFPDGSLWLVGETDLLLIGGKGPIAPLLGNIATNWSRPGVPADLARVDVRSPFSLLSLFVSNGATLRALGTGAPVQTDDRTALEFSAPRGLYERSDQGRWLAQRGARVSSPPESPARPETPARLDTRARPETITTAEAVATAADWRDRAAMLLRANADSLAYDAAVSALSLDPADSDALDALSRSAIALGRFPPAITLVQGLVERLPGSVAPLVELSHLQQASGKTDAALQSATLATTRFPETFAGWDQLATVATAAAREDRLASALSYMEAHFNDRWETHYHAARLHLLRGEYAEAVRMGEAVLNARPSDARALTVTGAAYASLGVRDRAREAFEASISSDPRDPEGYVSLGRFELDTFNPQRAAALFTEALFLDPHYAPALNGLADALTRMGRPERAAELRARARTL